MRRTASFEAIYRANLSFVFQTVRRAGVPDADVPDVVQDVFLTLAHAADRKLDTATSLRSWLRTTSYRKARDLQKLARNRERPSIDGDIEVSDLAPSPEENLIAVDLRDTVAKTLDTLPPPLRLVLVMSDVEEMPMRQIAEVMDMPLGTGFSRLRSARAAFSRAWDERRETATPALLPFMTWSAGSLLAAQRSLPSAPPELETMVWNRLRDALGKTVLRAGASAAAAGASSAAIHLTATQMAIGVTLSAMIGAGIHAGLGDPREPRPLRPTAALQPAVVPAPPASSILAPPDAPTSLLGADTLLPRAPVAPPASPPARPAGSALPNGTSRIPQGEPAERSGERILIERARRALAGGDVQGARDALDRHEALFHNGRFADEREVLRKLARGYSDGGQE